MLNIYSEFLNHQLILELLREILEYKLTKIFRTNDSKYFSSWIVNV